MSAQKGLGKGLGALFGELGPAEQPELPNLNLPIQKVEPNPLQPRKTFDQEELASLAESIRMNGIIQPLTVRKLPSGFYQIIAGERRYRASRLAGLEEIPAIVRDWDEQKRLEAALQSTLNVHARVRLVEPGAIPRSEGKAVRVVDKRKL